MKRKVGPRGLLLLTTMAWAGCGRGQGVEEHAAALSGNFVGRAVQSFGATTSDSAFGEQTYAAVAYGGGIFLTVWYSQNDLVLYAVRTRASDGAVLDPMRVRVASGVQLFTPPVVDWDGQDFFVAWSDDTSVDYHLSAARIGTDGHVLDATPISLHGSDQMTHLALAYGGGGHLLLWQEWAGGTGQYNVRGARFDTAGKMLGSVISFGALPTSEISPAVAFDGANFLVVWQDARDAAGDHPFANRVRASDGALLDGANGFRVGTSPHGTDLAVAFDGTNYLVAYRATDYQLVGSRLRPSDHSSLDATDLSLVSLPPTVEALHDSRLIFDGTHFALSWTRNSVAGASYELARIDPATGANLDAKAIVFATSPTWIQDRKAQDIAAGAGRVFAAFNEQDNPQQQLHASYGVETKAVLVNPTTGAVDQAAFLLSKSAHRQEAAASSCDGQHHLVVWHEWNGKHWEIRGARVSNQDGSTLDPQTIVIASSATAGQLYPRTASNGTSHLVVWWDGATLRANRVKGSDGSLLDGAGIALPGAAGTDSFDSPLYAVASDGSDYGVFWMEGGYSGPLKARFVRVRGSDGALLDATPRSVAPDAKNRYYARLAFSGSYYVALWIELTTGVGYQLRAARMTSDGTVVDNPALVVAKVSGFAKDPMIVGDGTNMLVAWSDTQLHARRLHLSDGSVLDASDIVIDSVSDDYAVLTFDGQNFLVAWSRPAPAPAHSEVVATRIGPAGALLDPAPTVISPPLSYYWNPGLSLSPGAGGNVLSTFVMYDSAADIETERLRARLLTDPPPPDAAPPPPPPPPPPQDAAMPTEAASPGADSAASPQDTALDGVGPSDAGASADIGAFEAPPSADDGSPPGDTSERADGNMAGADAGAISDAAADAAGLSSDSGMSDGGAVAVADGALADAIQTDVVSPMNDAGSPPGGGSGCACTITTRAPAPAWLAIVPLALLAFRRRRPVP